MLFWNPLNRLFCCDGHRKNFCDRCDKDCWDRHDCHKGCKDDCCDRHDNCHKDDHKNYHEDCLCHKTHPITCDHDGKCREEKCDYSNCGGDDENKNDVKDQGKCRCDWFEGTCEKGE